MIQSEFQKIDMSDFEALSTLLKIFAIWKTLDMDIHI